MPRTLRPLVLAAIVGSALTFGFLGLMSMTQSPTNLLEHVLVGYGPHPRDMVQIKEGTPYVVPAGKILVVTAVGQASLVPCGQIQRTSLKVNGTVELSTETGTCGGGGDLMAVISIARGFTATANSTIDLDSGGNGNGRAWGYLANE